MTGAADIVDWGPYLPLISALVALLLGLAIGKAWERYKLRDGRWIDRRKARDSQHSRPRAQLLVSNQIELAIEELSRAARVDADALEIHMILGNVYRERGQVSRAIQVHQALLQRPKLTRSSTATSCSASASTTSAAASSTAPSTPSARSCGSLPTTSTPSSISRSSSRNSTSGPRRTHPPPPRRVERAGHQPRNQAILGFLENALGTEALAGERRDEAMRHSRRPSPRLGDDARLPQPGRRPAAAGDTAGPSPPGTTSSTPRRSGRTWRSSGWSGSSRDRARPSGSSTAAGGSSLVARTTGASGWRSAPTSPGTGTTAPRSTSSSRPSSRIRTASPSTRRCGAS